MEIKVPLGKYVIAVSGGVDSMALLDMLVKMDGIELVVAHFDHGIRKDSSLDEVLVCQAAIRYGVVYETSRASLGPQASEEAARRARYGFLNRVVKEHRADMLITAHHQDDWIETCLINLLRGTGRQGVSAMLSNPRVLRPLINTPKAELLQYATNMDLSWREDTTNQNQDYMRNYMRATVLPKLDRAKRISLLENLDKVAKTNIKLDRELATLSHLHLDNLDRQEFSSLPAEVGQELIVYLLRRLGVKDYDKKTVERLSMAVKTAKPNSIHPVKGRTYLGVDNKTASFITP